MHFLLWLKDSAIGTWVRESDYGYAIVLSSHAIGMAIIVGAVLMFDIRILGFARQMSLKWFDQIYTLAWVGFGVNAVSGVLLFCGNPVKFTFSTAFQIKLALILAGGISVWVLGKQIENPENLAPDGAVRRAAKLTAMLSLLFWLGAITAGRLIAYTTSPI